MSLQYLKKEVRDKVDFLYADRYQNFPQVYLKHFEHQTFVQGDTIIIDGQKQKFLKYSR